MILSAIRAAGYEVTKLSKSPADKRPSLLVVTLPKSGTVYLNQVFQRSLGLEDIRLCNGYFPHDHLSLDGLRSFVSRGGYVAQTHLDPSTANLQLLDAFVPRWVVHVRDPRAALLSWTHHVRKLHGEGRSVELLRFTPTPPKAVLTGPLSECIDWHIDTFFRSAVDWLDAWMNVAEKWPDRIFVTSFAALKSQEDELCRNIAAFVGFDPSTYRHRPPEKTVAVHFRSGELNEWQTAFTREQIERTTSMIPAEFMKRFGWTSPPTRRDGLASAEAGSRTEPLVR